MFINYQNGRKTISCRYIIFPFFEVNVHVRLVLK